MVEDGVRGFLLVFFGFFMEEDGFRWILKFFLDFDLGFFLCILFNGFGGLFGLEGECSLVFFDVSIFISNVCSIGDYVV